MLAAGSPSPPPRSDPVFGISRMYQTLIDPDAATVRVFRNIREAYDWLGIDIEEVAEGWPGRASSEAERQPDADATDVAAS